MHRDIKPKNIFVKESGDLVLGDLGLVIAQGGDQPRVTEVYDNPGSRDWMPGWVLGKTRIEDVRPSVDVFALGKVLWCMVSGEHGLPLWYHDKPQYDLGTLFPENFQIPWITGILSKSVRENEADCLPDAGALLKEFDTAIEAISKGAQPLNISAQRRCWVCGIGYYIGMAGADYDQTRRFECSHCGHLQTFVSKGKPGWNG